MQVNFDRLRLESIKNYNAVVKELNHAIVEYEDMDRVVVPIEDIRRHLDNLRQNLIMIASVFDSSINDCKCVLDRDLEVIVFAEDN